jgi:hypothetical protein
MIVSTHFPGAIEKTIHEASKILRLRADHYLMDLEYLIYCANGKVGELL